jgi:zinc transporter 5/7
VNSTLVAIHLQQFQFQNCGRLCDTANMAIVLQITAYEDVSELCQGRFWELVPGHAVGCLSVRVR